MQKILILTKYIYLLLQHWKFKKTDLFKHIFYRWRKDIHKSIRLFKFLIFNYSVFNLKNIEMKLIISKTVFSPLVVTTWPNWRIILHATVPFPAIAFLALAAVRLGRSVGIRNFPTVNRWPDWSNSVGLTAVVSPRKAGVALTALRRRPLSVAVGHSRAVPLAESICPNVAL